MEADKSFVSLQRLSQILGLPADWLKSEAEAGRIPFITPHSRKVFNVKAVEQALNVRAMEVSNAQ